MATPTRVALPLLWLVVLGAHAAERPTPPAGSGEWTRFRGPNGGGISKATSIPVKWTEKDYNWKVKLPGGGHSSPVVWDNRVFVTCADRKTAQRMILCLKAADGSVVWRRDYESKPFKQNPSNSYAASTPAAGPAGLYLCWASPEAVIVLALGHDGKELWRRDLGPFVSQHGPCMSPILFEDMVVLANNQKGKSFLIALDCRTGKTRWQLERRSVKAAYSTPCVYRSQDGPPELIFTSTSHGVTSVDPKTGEVNWEFGSAFPLRVVGSPAIASGLIVGTCGVGGSGKRLVAVRPGSKKRGVEPQLAYEIKKSVPYVPTPLAKGDLLFLLTENGVAMCLRGSTGEQVWQGRLKARFYGSFVWVAGRLYAISRKGEVLVIAASEKFELLARNPLGERSQATPALAGGVMYLRTYSHLISIGGKETP